MAPSKPRFRRSRDRARRPSSEPTVQDSSGRTFSLRTMDALRKVLPARIYYRYIGRHERGSMHVWAELVSGLRPGSVVLDIGAYHGLYALETRELRPDLAIFAFEPNEQELESLRGACADKDISIVAAAVSDRDGFLMFSTSGETSHVVDTNDEHDHTVSVRAVTLDEWSRGSDLDVSLMKVDVEGGEAAVLEGASELMERCRPVVLCEVLSRWAGQRVAASLPPDYVFFEINEDKGPTSAPVPTRNHYRHKNWLLVPNEHRGHIPRGRAR